MVNSCRVTYKGRLGLLGALLVLLSGSALWGAAPHVHAASTVSVTFWNAYSKYAEKELIKQIAQFEKLYPAITINEVDAHSYNALFQKEQSAIFAGNPPVMGQAYENWVAPFLQSNSVVELTPFVNGSNGLSATDIKDYYPAMWADGLMPNGKRYMMPSSKSDVVLYYNPDILKSIGVMAAPQTWSDFAADAIKATKLTAGRPSQWGLSMSVDESTWYAIFSSYGSPVVVKGKGAFNNPKAAAAVALFRKLIVNGSLELVPSTSYQDQVDFTNGHTAFYIGSSAGLSYVLSGAKGHFTPMAAVLPAGPAGHATEMYGAPLVIFAKASMAQQAAAWTFMKWLTLPAQTADWSLATGYMPVRQSAVDLPAMKAYYTQTPTAVASVDSLRYAVVEPPLVGWAQSRDVIAQALQNALTGRMSASAALNAAAVRVTSLLAGGH